MLDFSVSAQANADPWALDFDLSGAATASISGTSAGTSTDTADPDIHIAGISTSAGTSTDTAAITIVATTDIAGTSAGTSSDSAAVSLALSLAGTSAGTSLDTAAYVDLGSVAFAIGFTRVRVERLDRIPEPLGQRRRTFSGKMRASIPEGDGWAVRWDLTTPMLPVSEIETLETELETPGIKTLNGTRVTNGTAAIVVSHSRTRTSADGGDAALSVEFMEVDTQ